MSYKIWTDVNLLTMSDTGSAYGLINEAALVEKDGLINWIGNKADMPVHFNGEIINCSGAYMTPGLIDCHTHLIYGGNRINEFEKRLNGATYEDIANAGGGILSTVRATRAATEDELVSSSLKRLRQLEKDGVTTIEIKSGYGLDVENEIKMLRAVKKLDKISNVDVVATFLGAHALPPEYHDNRDGYINLIIKDMLPKVAEEKLATAVDGFLENIGFSYSEMERVFSAAKEYGFDLKLHAEQLSDLSGAGLAAHFNALSADHLEHLSESSMDLMQKSGTVAVLLPGAYYTLRDTKLPPIGSLRKRNIPMAVATDSNPGSSPVLSLKLMINMASTIFGLTPEEALAGVTKNAAKALGLSDRGLLKAGLRADMVLWDISHPAELAYQVGGSPVLSVIKNGNVVYQNT
ncbi:MAG: imidazolonepropionase [Alphaproteobacteria bacterium]|nr:imidazolonepropionase [Alphaproteobacteria bacterium]HPF45270.1 imidazolonepropionase [Emcibacteraceae bacterium]